MTAPFPLAGVVLSRTIPTSSAVDAPNAAEPARLGRAYVRSANVCAPQSLLGDLVELARRDVEHEAAQGLVLRHERACLDAAQRLPNVVVHVLEGLGGPLRLQPRLVLDLLLETVVGEGQHA